MFDRPGNFYDARSENTAFICECGSLDPGTDHACVKQFFKHACATFSNRARHLTLSKKEGNDQDSIQSSTTPDPGYQ